MWPMRKTFWAALGVAAFAAAAITPAAAETPNGSWGTLSGGVTPPYTMEARLYGGWADANTFGWNVNSNVVGVGAGLRLPFNQFRWQTDFWGEESSYSSSVGTPSFLVGATHFDWMMTPNCEFGLFAGLDNAKPSFSGPQSLNAFFGAEGRHFFGPAVAGFQVGYLDNVSGPGTLIRTGFVDGRIKASVGDLLGLPAWRSTIIGGNLGAGWGTDSATLTSGQSVFGGISLSQGIKDTPFSLTFDYQHFENRVSGLGRVWQEDLFLGGFKVVLPSTPDVRGWKEPIEPLPIGLLRSNLYF
jgi:hypothetical protein